MLELQHVGNETEKSTACSHMKAAHPEATFRKMHSGRTGEK